VRCRWLSSKDLPHANSLFGWSPFVGLHILRSALSSVAEAIVTVATLLFSLIVASLSADLISMVSSIELGHYTGKIPALSLATRLLTVLIVGPMCNQTSVVVGCVTKSTLLPLCM
jgi:hypothetical protein